jgi:hypothetical protein
LSTRLRPGLFSIAALVGLSACPKKGDDTSTAPRPMPVAAEVTGAWVVDGADDLSPGRTGPATVVGTLTVDGLKVAEGATIRVDAGSADWSWMMDTPIRVQGDLALDGATWVLSNPGAPLPADGM